jgi:hypothetical protein
MVTLYSKEPAQVLLMCKLELFSNEVFNSLKIERVQN